MRQDQYERLQAMMEKLTDAFLREADPATWTGGEIPPAELTQQQRGDRYWCKKNAVATAALIVRTQSIVGKIQMVGAVPAAPEEAEEGADAEGGLDAEVAAAEAEGRRLLQRVIDREKKAGTPHGQA